MRTTEANIAKFRRMIGRYFRKSGRKLPWRETVNPYHILVSEIMLQQTQVRRVCEKYGFFISLFPDINSLARASLSDVLRAWSGLGYNRRAKFLYDLARKVVNSYGGVIPRHIEELVKLPGVGYATASSFLAFAYNQPTVFIETNIRTVFLHFFFSRRNKVHDKEILPLVEKTIDREKPREWYSALMDYGTMLKSQEENPSRKSFHHVKQSRFEGSLRQLRGQILAECLKVPHLSRRVLIQKLGSDSQKIEQALEELEREGFLEVNRRFVALKS